MLLRMIIKGIIVRETPTSPSPGKESHGPRLFKIIFPTAMVTTPTKATAVTRVLGFYFSVTLVTPVIPYNKRSSRNS
jgi:hypothetical protein